MTSASEFHFSPRPNRAHEIAWQPWGREAFARAEREGKPILLAISAVWCHWCHVMDETTYSDPSVIAAIAQEYVAVRVDNDRRPDVNARYNQGGWPTTAFLTPDGALIAGATYLPAAQMRQALEQVAPFFRSNRAKLDERAAQARAAKPLPAVSPSGELRAELIDPVIDAIARIYDPEFGGFGSEPKFPMADVLDFLLQEYRITGEQRLYEMTATSMLGMARGGMYDHVEGGFFRYSTTRDWSVPHFEKMTEDHAGLLRVLAGLVQTTRNERFRSTLKSALGYVRSVLLDPHTNLFAGSQDADEAYFALPLEDRRLREAPYVDRTSYSNWTAAMASAFFLAGNALDDDALVLQGQATLDALHDRLRDEDGLLYHFIEPGGDPQIRGLLTDQAAYLRALLDAHAVGGESRYFVRARALAAAIDNAFAAPDAGFFDRAGIEPELGGLRVPDRPLHDNAVLAECFLRLSSTAENGERYRDTAERTLALYVPTYEQAGSFAAPYARAIRRYTAPAVSVVLAGTVQETSLLREAAHALGNPTIAVRTVDPSDAEALHARGIEGSTGGVAYVCVGRICGPPARTAAELAHTYEDLTQFPGRTNASQYQTP